ncbi:MAG: VCBS repeat-containing protein [Planctomycetes bacterium]|nr:VCBS repeat-containing protein [Planctomycetota bacterium]MBL7043490.1 VCBS repeat-containing protein [Pirellulaceae bacterium]
MSTALTNLYGVLAAATVLLAMTPTKAEELFEVTLENPSFTKGVNDLGVPLGWSKYGGGGTDQELKIAEGPDDGKALLIVDGDPATEVGVSQAFDLKGGETYEVTAKVRGVEDASTSGSYLQFRFLPSSQYVQTGLTARSADRFTEVSVKGTAPPDTTKAMIYLYTHRDPTPKVMVTDVKLMGGLPPPPPPPPPPVPPQYSELKDLHLDTALVKEGKANVAIVAPASDVYQTAATAVQQEIERLSGVKVPIVSDDSPEAAVPITGNLIVLGNRSTNKTVSALYDLYYCLADLKYPGPEGYVIRSNHNPFGNGNSIVIVGASDDVGVREGAGALAGIVSKASFAAGELSIGWTLETKLGKGVEPPTDIKQFETWEASKGYGSVGYFGWTSISKRMAMYYMTGDEFSAREVVRLSFPDEQALKDIDEIDGERIENKQDPLAGFYHYNAHMAILFWDLIEESPVFTDEERLKITNAFARQLNHRKNEGVYGLTKPRGAVSSRHGQWSAISLYCLGRYFNKYYPDPVWAQCVRGGELAFHSLHEHAWIAGESDNLFWYNTGIAPVFTYMALTGDRKPLENGVLDELLRGQETLISGRVPDGALNSASMGFLNKAAYITGDGRWSTYRERTGVDTNLFRLGQSFWPDEEIEPKLPDDLVGRWSIHRLPEPAWGSRGSGLPFDQSFYFGSYRSTPDETGDFILLDGFNGASRNPYHTFDILELRLAGRTVLQGYHNQVLTSADGMVEPSVAMNAALLYADVVGPTATAVGEVPNAAFSNWRRTLSQRTGRYALVVDDLTFGADSQNMKVKTTWQVTGGVWDQAKQAVRIPAAGFELRSCDVQEVRGRGVVTMSWNGAVQEDEHRIAFYLIGQTNSDSPESLACNRVADNAAVLALPEAALAVVGEYGKTNGELVILAEDHLYGHAFLSAGIEEKLAMTDAPVDIDWDFTSGVATVVAAKQTTLMLCLTAADKLQVGGEPAKAQHANGICSIQLPEGRHVLTGASPAQEARLGTLAALKRLLAEGQKLRAEALASAGQQAELDAPELPVAMTAQVGGKVTDMITVPAADETQLAVAEGNTVHLLTPEGKSIRTLETDGKIRVLRWWDEHELLLAGCVDEKVIAFDSNGGRKWVFTSEMDPAVYQAAKTYWFKSAPGHEGIHGLFTGAFDEGKSRCFVGSACTLEILDETGTLVKRTPVFWGPGRMFSLVAARDGSRNLLISRWPNGNDHLAIVNSKTMTVSGRGYSGVPSGHSYVGGWTAQNRTRLFHEDLDGDGKKEVATTINGTWNRVTVYSEEGQPLHNAQFGPGARNTPRAQMRDMDIADLNGDGKKEIVVGLSEGLVVALTSECQKVWSTRLPSPPASLWCVGVSGSQLPWIVVGCDDGTVAALDGQGALTRLGKVTGRPMHMETLPTPAGSVAVLATDKGEVKGFKIGE